MDLPSDHHDDEPPPKKPRRMATIAIDKIKTLIPASQLRLDDEDDSGGLGICIPSRGEAIPFEIDESDPIFCQTSAVTSDTEKAVTPASCAPGQLMEDDLHGNKETDANATIQSGDKAKESPSNAARPLIKSPPLSSDSFSASSNGVDNQQCIIGDYDIIPVTIANTGPLGGSIGKWDTPRDLTEAFNATLTQHCCNVTAMQMTGLGAASGLRVDDVFVQKIEGTTATVALKSFETVKHQLMEDERPLSLLIARKRSQSELGQSALETQTQAVTEANQDATAAQPPVMEQAGEEIAECQSSASTDMTKVQPMTPSRELDASFQPANHSVHDSLPDDMDDTANEQDLADAFCESAAPNDDTTSGISSSSTQSEPASSNPTNAESNVDETSPDHDDEIDPRWLAMFEGLVAFKKEHGHFKVPRHFLHDGRKLSVWLEDKRRQYSNMLRNVAPSLSKRKVEMFRSIAYDLDPLGRATERSKQGESSDMTHTQAELQAITTSIAADPESKQSQILKNGLMNESHADMVIESSVKPESKMTCARLESYGQISGQIQLPPASSTEPSMMSGHRSEQSRIFAERGKAKALYKPSETNEHRSTPIDSIDTPANSATPARVCLDSAVHQDMSQSADGSTVYSMPAQFGSTAPRVTDGRHGLERRFMAWLDRRIFAAEEREFMETLSYQIACAEKAEMLDHKPLSGEGCAVAPMAELDRQAFALEERAFVDRLNVAIKKMEVREARYGTQRPSCTPVDASPQDIDSTMESRNGMGAVEASGANVIECPVHQVVLFLPSFQTLSDVDEPLWTFVDLEKILAPFKDLKGTITVRECAGDPLTICLQFVGVKDAIDDIMTAITFNLSRRCRKANFRRLTANGRKIPAISIDCSQPLGAKLRETGKGLLVEIAEGNELAQLARIVGVEKLRNGAAIIAVDGSVCASTASFKSLLEKCQADKRPLSIELCIAADQRDQGDHAREAGLGAGPSLPSDAVPVLDMELSICDQKDALSSTLPVNKEIEPSSQKDKLKPASSSAPLLKTRETESKLQAASRHMSPKVQSYTHFAKKFKESIDIEWKLTKISPGFVSGRMWARHKRTFGFHCDDKCRCVFVMASLCSSVVADKSSAASKEEWTNHLELSVDQMPVGFMSTYSDTFLPLIEKSYPTESPASLLGRLVKMWRVHEISCIDTCRCEDMIALTICRGSGDAFASTDQAVIPRKRKAHDIEASNGPPAESSCKIARAPFAASDSTMDFPEYHADFNSSESLGFFCVTEGIGMNQSVCKITSLAPQGQARSIDGRIQSGSIVVAASVDEVRENITTCLQLKNLYERAQRIKGVIRLSLINSDVSAASIVESEKQVPKVWSSQGRWRGSNSAGWDGGACNLLDDVHIIDTPAEPAENLPNLAIVDVDDTSSPTLTLQELKRDTRSQARGRSILKGGPTYQSLAGAPQSVVFAEDVVKETREYDPWRTSAFFWVMPQTDCRGELPSKAPTKCDIFEAVQRKSFNDLILLLKQGAGMDIDSSDTLQSELKKYIKPSQVDIRSQLESNPQDNSLRSIERDLAMKSKVLKICVEMFEACRCARALKRWAKFEMQILSISDLDLGSASMEGDLIVEPFTVLHHHQVAFSKLRTVPIASNVEYGENKHPYKTRVNALLEPRQWEIRLSQRYPSGVKVSLGSVILSTAYLEDCVQLSSKEVDDHWKTDTRDIIPTASSKLQGGNMRVKIRRIAIDAETHRKKRQHALDWMKKTLVWMENFNTKELTDTERMDFCLTGDMRVGVQPLLDAAVLLEAPASVQKILDLGVTSTTSALSLAYGMEERERHLTTSCTKSVTSSPDGDSPTVSMEHQDQQSHLAQIIEILKRHGHACNRHVEDLTNDDSSASPSSPSSFSSLQKENSEADGLSPSLSKPESMTPSLTLVPVDIEAHVDMGVSLNVSQLPNLDLEKWVWYSQIKYALCDFAHFSQGYQKARSTCHYIHLHSSWGSHQLESLWPSSCKAVDSLLTTRDVETYTRYLVKSASEGSKKWVTAKYWTVASGPNAKQATDQHIILAEGGSCQVSTQGICWYLTKQEALDALVKTVQVTLWSLQPGNKPNTRLSGPAKLLIDGVKETNRTNT